MRVLVCGSRHFNDSVKMKEVLDAIDITTIIEGEARGADKLSAIYAGHRGIPVERYPADWKKFGFAAGPIRNTAMLAKGKPDLVVAFRGPNSRGTQNMIDQATKAGIETRIIEI